MARKAAASKVTVGADGSVAAAPSIIHCPACACEISSDGKKLITRSPKMEEYAELDKAFDKIEERLKNAETANQLLLKKNQELEEKLKNVGQKGHDGGSKSEPATDSGKPSWYKRKS